MFLRNLISKKIKLVCFDLDNTLCYSQDAESSAEVIVVKKICSDLNSLLKKNSLKSKKHYVLTEIEVLKIFNEVKNSYLHHELEPRRLSREFWYQKTFQKITSKYDILIPDNFVEKNCFIYEELYWKTFEKEVKLFPNTIKLLDFLKNKGLKLAILSDSDGRKEIKLHRIKKLGIDKYFDYILTADDTTKNKPAKINWEHLLKVSGFSAKECVMIGDHPEIDLLVPKKMGLKTIWTKESFNVGLHWNYVDYEIIDIIEVEEIVKKLI